MPVTYRSKSYRSRRPPRQRREALPKKLTAETIEELGKNTHILMRALSMVEELSVFRDEVPWVKEWSHKPDLPAVIDTLKDLAQAASDRNEAIERNLGLLKGDGMQ